jgi:nicotinamidase-related amidase
MCYLQVESTGRNKNQPTREATVEIEIEAQSAALVLIDLQQGIVGRQTAPYPAAEVIWRCSDLAATFREAKALVVYVRVDLGNFLKVNADAPLRDPGAPPPPASASELVPEAGRQEGDLLITKRHWSAFLGTELEQEFRSHGVRTMVIGGIATNFGVESTARDAAGLGFDVVFAEDAMTSVAAEAHHFAVETIFPRLGRVRKADEVKLV